MRQVTLNGTNGDQITFYGDIKALPDVSDGVRYAFSTLDGWDSPDVRTALVEKPATDGAYIGDFFFGPRILELSGGFYGLGPPQISDARNRLSAMSSTMVGSTMGTLYVLEGNDLRFVQVRRSGRLLMRTVANGNGCEFQLPLVAPDPRKYSTLQQVNSVPVGGVSSLTMGGNYHSPPIIYVTGPGTYFSIQILQVGVPGGIIELSPNLSPGQSLTINMRDRTIIRNDGVSLRNSLNPGFDYFDVQPGVSTVYFFADGSDGNTEMSIEANDAYI